MSSCGEKFIPPDWFMCLASLNHVILVISGSVNFLIYCTYGNLFKTMLQKLLNRYPHHHSMNRHPHHHSMNRNPHNHSMNRYPHHHSMNRYPHHHSMKPVMNYASKKFSCGKYVLLCAYFGDKACILSNIKWDALRKQLLSKYNCD